MIGAIAGDIAGSRFEWHNHKSKDFELYTDWCGMTDDSMMTIAVAAAILDCRTDADAAGIEYSKMPAAAIKRMQEIGRKYPDAGYGGHFRVWLTTDDPAPYNSWGNGSAMRVSPAGWAGRSLDEVKEISRLVTEVTHNHPEGVKGAEAVAVAIYMARTGSTMAEMHDVITRDYYKLDFTLDEIRPDYEFDVSCRGSVPQALEAFFESTDFEDCIRNAVSIGGDSDTIAAIAGSVAEAFYGVPGSIREAVYTYMGEDVRGIVDRFEATYGAK